MFNSSSPLACRLRPTGSLSQAAASVPRSGVAAIGSTSFLCAGVRDRIRAGALPDAVLDRRRIPNAQNRRAACRDVLLETAARDSHPRGRQNRKGSGEGRQRQRRPSRATVALRCLVAVVRLIFLFSLLRRRNRGPRGSCCGPWELQCRPPTAPLSARADSTRNLSWASMGCWFLAEEAFSLSPGVWSMLDALAQTSGCGKLGKPLQLMPWLRLDKGRIRHTDTRRLVIHVAPAWPGLCLQKDAPTRNLVAHLTLAGRCICMKPIAASHSYPPIRLAINNALKHAAAAP